MRFTAMELPEPVGPQRVTPKTIRQIEAEVKQLIAQTKELADSTAQDLKDMGPYLDRI